MTLTAAERGYLKNASVRECRVKFWLFDDLGVNFSTAFPTVDTDITATTFPTMLISPPHSLVKPGESVVLYAGDSYRELSGSAVTSWTWSVVSGSAIITPAGSSCTVMPTGGEDSVVVVRCASTNDDGTGQRDARVACSTNGWAKPAGRVDIRGGYSARGWSGSVEVAGDSATGLAQGKFLLIHIETVYDGLEYTIGGYKRANNLCLLMVKDWTYSDGPDGHKICHINLISPADYLNGFFFYMLDPNISNQERPLLFTVDNYYLSGNTPIYYHTTPSPARSTSYMARTSPVTQYFNVTIWDDVTPASVIQAMSVDLGPAFDMLRSPVESILGVAFCDFAGSLNFIPHPAVRADEWWGTPDPIWDSTNPLTTDYCNRSITYYPGYHESGQAWDGLILAGYVDDANLWAYPYNVAAGTITAGRLVNRDYSGYLLDDAGGGATSAIWANDLLALVNRTWDVDATFFGLGNTLNVGSFVYVDLDPEQEGQPVVGGLAYIDEIGHQIDIERRMQTTQAHMVQLTGSLT